MANPQHPKPSSRTFAEVGITAAGGGPSEEINISGLTLSCVQMSTAWTAANLGFHASVDGSTKFYTVYDTVGNPLTYPTGASRVLVFDPAQFAGLQKLKVVSMTTAGANVGQAADRTLVLGLSEYVQAN